MEGCPLTVHHQRTRHRWRWGFPGGIPFVFFRSPVSTDKAMAHALVIYNQRNPDAPKKLLGQTWWINFREWQNHCFTISIPDIDCGRASCVKSGPIEEYFRRISGSSPPYGPWNLDKSLRWSNLSSLYQCGQKTSWNYNFLNNVSREYGQCREADLPAG